MHPRELPTIGSRLPALHREQGGAVLESLLGAAQALVDEARARRDRLQERTALLLARLLESDGSGRSPDGTLLALRRWLGLRAEGAEVWTGCRVDPVEGGSLLVVRSERPSVVVARVEPESVTSPARLRIPAALLPVECDVTAVSLTGWPRPCPPIPGAVLSGRRWAVERAGSDGSPASSREERVVVGE